ncbi:hypothetical protein CEXT_503151 [Caerostris extrusa]|uniref:Uncharacterized protein n=1 Tax=Caerostris extrusa TaxID=172846 RepID=A0AAV4YB30_CAEEX|nr:hypothetical protein CEXT_503151 [Caerostris extrusa]
MQRISKFSNYGDFDFGIRVAKIGKFRLPRAHQWMLATLIPQSEATIKKNTSKSGLGTNEINQIRVLIFLYSNRLSKTLRYECSNIWFLRHHTSTLSYETVRKISALLHDAKITTPFRFDFYKQTTLDNYAEKPYFPQQEIDQSVGKKGGICGEQN